MDGYKRLEAARPQPRKLYRVSMRTMGRLYLGTVRCCLEMDKRMGKRGRRPHVAFDPDRGTIEPLASHPGPSGWLG